MTPYLSSYEQYCNKYGHTGISLYTDFITSAYIPSGRISGSYNRSIFSFLRNVRTVLHGEYYLHSHQQCTWVPFFPHLHQYWLYFCVFNNSLHGVRGSLIVALTCISLTAHDVEKFFICLLAIYISSCKNVYSDYLPIL